MHIIVFYFVAIMTRIFLIFYLLTINRITAVQEDDVSFSLFTKKTTRFLATSKEIGGQLDEGADIVFIVHGWLQSGEKPLYKILQEVFLSRTDKINNVIQVNWFPPATRYYGEAAISAKDVGRIIGEFILDLYTNHNVPLSKFHVVGFSLGAQVAGYVGKTILDRTRLKIGRITALDPAGPLFEGIAVSDQDRLISNDADVILAIHTDGGIFGYLSPMGTVDVFVNGGSRWQPGCPHIRDDVSVFCSHTRAFQVYVEALQTGIPATRCYSYVAFRRHYCTNHHKIDIGGDLGPEDRGLYFLRTNAEPPFRLDKE